MTGTRTIILLSLAALLPRSAADAAAPLPGDYNGDWSVDANDYALLRKSGGDYSTWRSNFGKSAANVGIVINPGDDIQAKIDASPINSLFYVKAGERRLTTGLSPKSGDVFVAEPGATLNGSRLLTNFTPSASTWYVTGQTQAGSTFGECMPGYSQCSHPEDLFLDDKPLLHVSSLAEVGPGKWYFDYLGDRIYMGDNPSGHKVETSIADHAISGTASGVGLYGFTVEKFAVKSQDSAIQADGPNWTVAKNNVMLNHASGVQGSDGAIVKNNFIHDNGQEGVTANFASNATFDGNEISHNNYAHYDTNWEGGGSKFWSTTNLVVRNNYVHDNFGNGLWTDTDNVNTLYEGNTVTNNYLTGILHEISYNATIRNNISKDNAVAATTTLSGQIVAYSSSHVEVYGNTIESNAFNSQAIMLIQEDRGPGILGEHYSHDNYIHDNTTTLLAGATGDSSAMTGMASFDSYWPSANNVFDYNTYYVPDPSAEHWQWGQDINWTQFRAAGQEAHGHLYANAAGVSGAVVSEPSTGLLLIAALCCCVHGARRH